MPLLTSKFNGTRVALEVEPQGGDVSKLFAKRKQNQLLRGQTGRSFVGAIARIYIEAGRKG